MYKIVVANLKMGIPTLGFREYVSSFSFFDNAMVALPHTSLHLAKEYPHTVVAQDYDVHDGIAHTGQVSVHHLTECGVRWVMIGHSETRTGDDIVDSIPYKVNTALANGLSVILCVGESAEVKAAKETLHTVLGQLESALVAATADIDRVMIAYEPIWAIGSGQSPTAVDIDAVVSAVKQVYACKVLYGGSVNETNIHELANVKSLDGVLVGGASMDMDVITRIIKGINA